MKRVFISVMMVLFATTAFAATTEFALQPLYGQGREYVDPCPGDAPVPTNGLCGDGRTCPVGYEPVAKTCWDGHWFKPCGTTCRNMHLWDN